MSFVYSSNSPEFLNYIAHSKTRNDIINDPKLCVLLEDPHIKDNMELALQYRAAQYGDYDAKAEFIGFFLANAPEIDTDTIMYYREKILHNPVYMEIYQHDFSDLTIIDKLRVEKYKKDTTETNDLLNCLQNPCEYLGPFSSSIGLMGDNRNFNTLSNVFARITSEPKKDKDGKVIENDTSSTTWGNIRQHVVSKLIPNIEKSYRVMMSNMSQSFEEFGKKLEEAGLKKETQTVGDSEAESRAAEIAASVKVNVVSNLGDCSRLWENMRRLRVFDSSKNTKAPLPTVGPKDSDGKPKSTYNTPTDTDLKPKQQVATIGGEGKTLIKKDKELPKKSTTETEAETPSNENQSAASTSSAQPANPPQTPATPATPTPTPNG